MSARLSHPRMIAGAIASIGLLAAVLVSALAGPGAEAAEMTQRERALSRSEGLQRAAAITDLNLGGYMRANETIQREAAEIEAGIPLPPNGTLKDAGVEDAAAQGGTSRHFLEMTLQVNASCDWYRYAAGEGAQDETALRIVKEIPNWSVFRNDPGSLSEQSDAIAEALAGGDRGPLERHAATFCAPLEALGQ